MKKIEMDCLIPSCDGKIGMPLREWHDKIAIPSPRHKGQATTGIILGEYKCPKCGISYLPSLTDDMTFTLTHSDAAGYKE